MGKMPTYKELEQRVRELEAKALEGRQAEEALLEEGHVQLQNALAVPI